MMQQLIRWWFGLSALLVAFAFGCLFAMRLLPMGAFWLAVAFLLSLSLLQVSLPKVGSLPRRYVVAVLLGLCVWEYNVLFVQQWVTNSYVLLHSSVLPVQHFAPGDGAVSISQAERSRQQKIFQGVSYDGSVLPSPVLISFRAGLAVADRKEVQFITRTGSMLASAATLPDGSFFLYNDVSDTLVPSAMLSEDDVLTRAVVRDGALHKIWERRTAGLYIHHWGDIFRGVVYQPGRRFQQLPADRWEGLGETFAKCTGQSVIDTVLMFDAESGELRQTVEVLPLIARYAKDHPELQKLVRDCDDPTHLNDIQVIKNATHAASFPDARVGDIILSFRQMHTIVLLDRDTLAVKWHLSEPFRAQHSPRLTNVGTMLVFDNLGGSLANGRSRILEIAIESKEVVGIWEETGDGMFHAQIRGKILPTAAGFLIQDQTSINYPVSLFVLACDTRPISTSACERKNVFHSNKRELSYDNVLVLQGKEAGDLR